jgi:hypothetical protein
MIVLDANIPIRAVLGRRVRQLIDTYAGHLQPESLLTKTLEHWDLAVKLKSA